MLPLKVLPLPSGAYKSNDGTEIRCFRILLKSARRCSHLGKNARVVFFGDVAESIALVAVDLDPTVREVGDHAGRIACSLAGGNGGC